VLLTRANLLNCGENKDAIQSYLDAMRAAHLDVLGPRVMSVARRAHEVMKLVNKGHEDADSPELR